MSARWTDKQAEQAPTYDQVDPIARKARANIEACKKWCEEHEIKHETVRERIW